MEERRVVDPSPRKLSEARARGWVAQSETLILGGLLVALAAWLPRAGAGWIERWSGWLRSTLARPPGRTVSQGLSVAADLILQHMASWFMVIIPVILMMTWVQIGPLWAGRALGGGPSLIQSPSRMSSLFRGLSNQAVLLLVSVGVLVSFAPALFSASSGGVSELSKVTVAVLVWAASLLGAALIIVGAADLSWSRWHTRRALMMTRREAKARERDEVGCPAMRRYRQRLRRGPHRAQYRLELQRALMLVAGYGDWVVMLQPGAPPIVQARVQGQSASMMLGVARAEGVFVAHDASLAYALVTTPIGTPIPRAAFAAVSRLSLRAQPRVVAA